MNKAKKLLLSILIASLIIFTACAQGTNDTEVTPPVEEEIDAPETENEADEQDTVEEQADEQAQEEKDTSEESPEIVAENEAFKIFQPAPNTEVKDRIVVKGLARVYEGTVLYEFEDGHYILDEGFTTATAGAPEWGEFEIIIEFDELSNNSGSIILFEESAEDGSRVNELIIPVTVADRN
ncbi:Gmad2 immunoglobulin-like domain-containing protein [Oceanobacillus saliphilus]|uniref:Gmad2 immunoglobulin-like domain-containing protein n=1 Tax=Oceanobacillus saliphilus TaxID=2925834 RepID=UPI00201E07F0|nr:Gmad2 immunoglobulin-like domain-containing protein [Oceanobacillus saliphilus]